LTPLYSFQIYTSTSELPLSWDKLAVTNIFLSKTYLEVLEFSAPKNMICHFIGIFDKEELVGITLSQFIDANQLESFGERDRCYKTKIRNFIFKQFASHVLFIGNNMLTGQNAYVFSKEIDLPKALKTIHSATSALQNLFKSQNQKIHITSIKDFNEDEIEYFQLPEYDRNYLFSIQPNMVFTISELWNSEQDYIDALTKKYRDQYKRARKKLDGIEKKKMKLQDIITYEDVIYDLYFHVAKNAPFNTFFLAKNHFRTFKEKLKENFLFYGYFENGKLIGFNTLIKNGKTLDTYFLGYDDSIQKEKMLYLNMLYDMIGYAINKKFETIVFARTALEIKSSVGAKPIKMYGLIEHSNRFINSKMSKIFPYLEPEMVWQERNPFK
jgi:Peptidogalycan biosysnthesis/recognition